MLPFPLATRSPPPARCPCRSLASYHSGSWTMNGEFRLAHSQRVKCHNVATPRRIFPTREVGSPMIFELDGPSLSVHCRHRRRKVTPVAQDRLSIVGVRERQREERCMESQRRQRPRNLCEILPNKFLR